MTHTDIIGIYQGELNRYAIGIFTSFVTQIYMVHDSYRHLVYETGEQHRYTSGVCKTFVTHIHIVRDSYRHHIYISGRAKLIYYWRLYFGCDSDIHGS